MRIDAARTHADTLARQADPARQSLTRFTDELRATRELIANGEARTPTLEQAVAMHREALDGM